MRQRTTYSGRHAAVIASAHVATRRGIEAERPSTESMSTGAEEIALIFEA
jgi:hypothetical protein